MERKTGRGDLSFAGCNRRVWRQSPSPPDVRLNVLVMQQPEAYLGSASEFFDQSGGLADEGTRKFLASFIEAYAKWVTTCLAISRLTLAAEVEDKGFDGPQKVMRIEGMTSAPRA